MKSFTIKGKHYLCRCLCELISENWRILQILSFCLSTASAAPGVSLLQSEPDVLRGFVASGFWEVPGVTPWFFPLRVLSLKAPALWFSKQNNKKQLLQHQIQYIEGLWVFVVVLVCVRKKHLPFFPVQAPRVWIQQVKCSCRLFSACDSGRLHAVDDFREQSAKPVKLLLGG